MRIEVNALELRRALHVVRYAMSTDTTRTHLNGALLAFEGPGATNLVAVATDGHWMCRWSIADRFVTVTKADEHTKLQIRAHDVTAILSALGPKPADIAIIGTKNRRFRYGAHRIALAESPSTFPPYQSVAPKLGPHRGFSCVSMEPRLMMKLLRAVEAARVAHGFRLATATLAFHNVALDPITVTSDEFPQFMGVIMPCRTNANSAPDRITNAKPVEAAAQ